MRMRFINKYDRKANKKFKSEVLKIMTKVEMFKKIANVEAIRNDAEMLDFINGEIVMLETRRANKKPTKTQEENMTIKEMIVTALKDFGKPVRVKDLRDTHALEEYTSQKLTALLNQLVKTGEVKRVVDKKVTTFEIANA